MSGHLTDSRRMWKLAHERGADGLHNHDARRLGVSGNPSQRAKDIADHVPFWTKRQARNGRPGSLYFADGFQPSDATRVVPNNFDGASPSLPVDEGDRSAAGSSPTVVGGARLLLRDYRNPEQGWVERAA